MTPEQEARQKIDQQLVQCGWLVQSAGEMNISAGRGVAIREFPLKTGFADYLLYADCKAIGGIEAKPEGYTAHRRGNPVGQVHDGPARRTAAFPPAAALRLRVHGHGHPVHQLPGPRSPQPGGLHLPSARGTGPAGDPRNPTPGQPAQHAGTGHHGPVEGADRGHPQSRIGPWPPATRRALIQMATGSGKTFTAVTRQLPAHQVRQGQADPVPGGPQQPGQADPQRVPAVRQPVQQLQVHRGIHGPAPSPQHHRPGRQGLHHDDPAPLLDPQGRGGVRGGERGRLAVRVGAVAGQGADAGRLQPQGAHRDLRRHHRGRVPPLDLQRLAAGAGILRRLHHRPHRHPYAPDASASSTATSSRTTATRRRSWTA